MEKMKVPKELLKIYEEVLEWVINTDSIPGTISLMNSFTLEKNKFTVELIIKPKKEEE